MCPEDDDEQFATCPKRTGCSDAIEGDRLGQMRLARWEETVRTGNYTIRVVHMQSIPCDVLNVSLVTC